MKLDKHTYKCYDCDEIIDDGYLPPLFCPNCHSGKNIGISDEEITVILNKKDLLNILSWGGDALVQDDGIRFRDDEKETLNKIKKCLGIQSKSCGEK